jgi:hypothetical protein
VNLQFLATVHDSHGRQVSSASGLIGLAPPEIKYYRIDAQRLGGETTVSGATEGVVLDPADPSQWLDLTVNGLSGNTTNDPGEGQACWIIAGDAPRTGKVKVIIHGIAEAELE